jgi:CDP-4-dehydro-6-deoxyglucose reductase, E3
VKVLPAGREFAAAADETLLAAAIRQGIGLPYGCKDGACGSCRARLLEGRVTHRPHQDKALSAADEAAGVVLTCCAVPQSDCAIESRQVTAAGQFPVQKMPVRVQSIERVSADVAILTLQLPATLSFQFHAGQYLDVLCKDGARRSYSMATAPGQARGSLELHIRHLPGGLFTDHVFGAMKEKEILRTEGPFGSFYLREGSDKPVVLLASGTGFAPIQAIIEHMKAAGVRRPTTLYWGCRRRADLYRHEWALAQAAELPWLSYVPVLSDASPEDGWGGRTGLVHQAVMADVPDLGGHEVYACGAPVMVDSALRDFTQRCGLPEEAFFADAFVSEADRH